MAKRYRATEPYPWEYRVTDVLEGRYVATCTIEGMAEVIAAALNAAEDAGRWKDDVRFLLGFVPEWAKEVPEGFGETFYGTLSAAGDRAVKARVDAIRQALKVEP